MSTFSLNEFYKRNRRSVIWAIFFGLLWVLRDFFGLVFLTFVLAFAAAPLAEFGNQRLRMRQGLSLSLVYLLFLLAIGSFVRFVAPDIASEANRLIGNLPQIEQSMVNAKNNLLEQYPSMRQPLNGFLRSALEDDFIVELDEALATERVRLGLDETVLLQSLETGGEPGSAVSQYLRKQDQLLVSALMTEQFQHIRQLAPAAINMVYRGVATTLLALLFSFLLLMDLGRIKHGVGRLRNSRVGDFYEEAAMPVVRFGLLLGRSLEAQAMIAVINTLLTLVGLWILDIPLMAMLSAIVFVCSFIPVLGVFISTTPIVLVALNAGGLSLSFGVIGLIVIIHAVEAYLLNPFIYGRHLKLNPVLTVMILYAGYHVFGLWGMLLGVPVARYFLHDVLGVPLRNRTDKPDTPLAPEPPAV